MTQIEFVALTAALIRVSGVAHARKGPSTTTTFPTVNIGGLNISYREAGPKDAPTLLLFHGFPSSSRMFDRLIPLLADRCHIVAPDYPSLAKATRHHRINARTRSTISRTRWSNWWRHWD